jgi:hypothetical protein
MSGVSGPDPVDIAALDGLAPGPLADCDRLAIDGDEFAF